MAEPRPRSRAGSQRWPSPAGKVPIGQRVAIPGVDTVVVARTDTSCFAGLHPGVLEWAPCRAGQTAGDLLCQDRTCTMRSRVAIAGAMVGCLGHR